MPPPPSTSLRYIVLAVQIDESVSNAVAHDYAIRPVDRVIEELKREFHIELESMTVLDDLNFASGGVENAETQRESELAEPGQNQDQRLTLKEMPCRELCASPINGTASRRTEVGYPYQQNSMPEVATGPLAELSPDESSGGQNEPLTTKPLGEDNSNPAANTLNNSPSPAMDGCLENGIRAVDRLGTHNAEQPGKAVSDALADGLISPTSPLQSERCTTSQEAPVVGRAPRFFMFCECSYCELNYNYKPCGPEDHLKKTHGICDGCAEIEKSKIERMRLQLMEVICL